MAAPTFFKQISIPDENGQFAERFVDGGLKCNNPIKELMDEAKSFFGESRKLGVILSLGTGHPGPIGLPQLSMFQGKSQIDLKSVLSDIVTDCETFAVEVRDRFVHHPNKHFRFSVTHGVGTTPMEEWEKMGEIKSHTMAYLQDGAVSREIDSLVEHLCGTTTSNQTLTLGDACASK